MIQIKVSLNLPPVIRLKIQNILLVGVIPGPNYHKNLESVLFLLVQEFLQLENGVPDVWNSSRQKTFTLTAHICVIGMDMPGREKLMNCKGKIRNSSESLAGNAGQ